MTRAGPGRSGRTPSGVDRRTGVGSVDVWWQMRQYSPVTVAQALRG